MSAHAARPRAEDTSAPLPIRQMLRSRRTDVRRFAIKNRRGARISVAAATFGDAATGGRGDTFRAALRDLAHHLAWCRGIETRVPSPVLRAWHDWTDEDRATERAFLAGAP